ncbi:hypothetical protein [Pseudomonas tremae]|uniref:hypothetical protein n=1 Tax=Pseudomonas tremae TaxID=200454 RepID=UPI001F39EB28|nr:hypothetical protein [Pseudomonas tremae]MCF5803829.1 hypothetical protein [Pseudomonas tremae]MCF5810621.1 hypothetical protein [Pseudomonas tremae]
MNYFNILHDDWFIFAQLILAGVAGAWLAWTLWYVNEEKKRYSADRPPMLKEGRRARMTILAMLLLVGVGVGVGAALLVLVANWDLVSTTFATIATAMVPGRLAKFHAKTILRPELNTMSWHRGTG